jgi:hypothetical protein
MFAEKKSIFFVTGEKQSEWRIQNGGDGHKAAVFFPAVAAFEDETWSAPDN